MKKVLIVIFSTLVLLTGISFLLPNEPVTETIHVAVASNFSLAFDRLAVEYEKTHDVKIMKSTASTGVLYTQLKNGAPYAIFLSADENRPSLLKKSGDVRDSYVYAHGRLVLWSPAVGVVGADGHLELSDSEYFAIANPLLAPYGRASSEVLGSMPSWDVEKKRVVRGENISQVLQFISSSNARVGIIAYSQYLYLPPSEKGSMWLIPEQLHEPIYQEGVLLSDSDHALGFFEYLKSPKAKKVIIDAGYGVQ